MAKFAQVTYGSHGDTQTYTYIVNDSVKAGAVVYPTVTHYKSKKDFSTMGIVQETNKMYKKGKQIVNDEGISYEQLPTKKGQEIIQELQDKNKDILTNKWNGEPDQRNMVSGIKYIKTGTELGIKKQRESGTGKLLPDINKMPSRATETTPSGMKATTLDPTQHLEPKKSYYGGKAMKEQLKSQTVYGFETIYPNKNNNDKW